MPEADLKQLNVHLDPSLVETEDRDGLVEALERDHGWTRRDTVAVAIRTLKALMDAHEACAAQYEDDPAFAELYMRLAREAPAGFIDVPKEGVRRRRIGGEAMVQIDQWLVFADHNTGALLAEEQGGEGRVGCIVDGEIKPLKFPTAAQVAVN